MQTAAICSALALLAVTAAPGQAATFLPDFSPALFRRGAVIDNSYFPLRPGQVNVLRAEGVDEDGEPVFEHTERSYAGRGPKILGVRATTLLDRAYEEDVLVEETYDYFAQDRRGNVWYLGEDVTNYRYDDDGNFLGTDSDSAWRAGVNGAEAGWIMPAELVIGQSYYQEHAPVEEALDFAITTAVLGSLEVAGRAYAHVLQVFESNEAEPDAREYKYYAPGIGLIRAEEDLDEALSSPGLTFNRDAAVSAVPLPAPALLLGAGMLALAGIGRRRGVRRQDPA